MGFLSARGHVVSALELIKQTNLAQLGELVSWPTDRWARKPSGRPIGSLAL